MAAIERAAYLASAELAREKGAFPLYDAERFLASAHVQRLPQEVREAIARHGIRNGLLTSIAPDRHHLAAGRQRLERHRAGVRLPLRAPRARARRLLAHRDRRGLCARPLPPDVRRQGAADRRLRDGRGAQPPRASGDAGGPAAPCRQLDLQDHQLPRRHLLRGLQGRLPRRLRPGPQGLHDLPAECRDGRRAQPHAPKPAPPRRRASPRPLSPCRHRKRPKSPLLPGLVLPERAGEVVYMAKPLEREGVLAGYTYKIRWPSSDHAMYITINDIERDGPAGGGHSTRRGRSRSSSTPRTSSTTPGRWRSPA